MSISMDTIQYIHITIDIAMIIAVVKVTMVVSELNFKVNMMWKEFNLQFHPSPHPPPAPTFIIHGTDKK